MSEIQQFCILAQSQKGRACAALIEQALSNRRLFFYEELLAIPSVQALNLSDYTKVFRTLQLFAHGEYHQYVDGRNEFLELSPHQIFKLRQLSLLQFFQQKKIVSYGSIIERLQLAHRKEVEELVMESISSGLLFAKIDQLNSIVHVFLIQNPPSQIGSDELHLSSKFEAWKSHCASTRVTLSNTINQGQHYAKSAELEKTQIATIWERNRKILREEIESAGEGSLDPRRK